MKSKVIKEVIPAYPEWALREGVEGAVVVEVTISTQGRVLKARATSGPGRLRTVAERAARQWVFRPVALATGSLKARFAMTFTFTTAPPPSTCRAAQLPVAAERAQRVLPIHLTAAARAR